MILFIDWETTGLPLKGEPSENPAHPHACSVAARLDDDQGKTRASFYSLIHVPPEVEWEPKAYEANQLTHHLCNRFGRPLFDVMRHLDRMAEEAEVVCAFSHFFDAKFWKIGCARVGGDEGAAMRDRFEQKGKACTMEASAHHFKGPKERFIKLSVAYQSAFGHMFDGAHTALEDNDASRRLYYWLIQQGSQDFGPTTVVGMTQSESAEGQLNDAIAQVRKRPAALG